MIHEDAVKRLGQEVIVDAELWGVYSGKLIKTWINFHAPNDICKFKVVVKIHECIKEPSQLTVDGSKKCSRLPYKKGQEIDFNLVDVRLKDYR